MNKAIRISAALRKSTLAGRRTFTSSSIQHAFSKFAMPSMSPTMTEGGISGWKKKEGEAFSAGDIILDIETDKATMDVEAQDDGVLAKIITSDGSKGVAVGKTIAILAEEGDDLSSSELQQLVQQAQSEGDSAAPSQPKQEESKPSTPPPSAPQSEPSKSESSAPAPSTTSAPTDRIFVSPLARKLALERGIPLAQLKGSGPNGRIIKADIDSYKPSTAPSATTSAAAPSAAAPAPAGENYIDIPLSNMRKTIASRLTESKQSVPHYQVTSEINVDRVLKLRQLFNKASAEGAGAAEKQGVKPGVKLSVNDFIIKATAIANSQVPECNSAWHGDFIRQYNQSDISMAVSTPTGLITPIITNVNARGLASISAESKSLAAKARDGKLKPNEYQGGTFSISNMGMFNSVSDFTAIVNLPQSCILAVATTQPKVVKDQEATAAAGEIKFKEINVMKVTMSADHRIVDGALAAKWLEAFKAAMENPLTFML